MKINRDGRDIKQVLEWLLRRRVNDSEIAEAIGMAAATYSRHKDKPEFPSFEDLARIGESFGFSPRVLQISFGYRGEDEVVLLDDAELNLHWQLGGGGVHHPTMTLTRKGVKRRTRPALRVRADAPPL